MISPLILDILQQRPGGLKPLPQPQPAPPKAKGQAPAEPVPTLSLFTNCKANTPSEALTLAALVSGVRDGRWRARVETCRATLRKDGAAAYSDSRGSVPAVTLSAHIKTRAKAAASDEQAAVHSGLLQIDLDCKEHPDRTVEDIRAIVEAAPFIAACFVSLSGKGVKGVARVPASIEQHGASWLAAAAYFKQRGLTVDPSTKDLRRLCFVSFDPDVFTRTDAAEIVPLEVSEVEPGRTGEGHKGSVRVEFARQVAAELAGKFGRPPRADWLKISSAFFDGVGVEAGTELLEEAFPPEVPDEYQRLAKSLRCFVAWDTLRAYGVDPDDWVSLLPDLPADDGGTVTKPTRKPLAAFLVNHAATLGLSWEEIDALRPPIVIDQFVRRGEVLLLGAESKSRKSWLTQDAGIAVAAGVPWLADEDGRSGFATVQARVHVFDLELNSSEMRYRFAKARGNRFANAPDAATSMTAGIAAYSLDGMNVAEILPLLEELKATVQPGDLVIVDCLYRLAPDGNEVAPLAGILETVKRFAAETQAGVIVVDHFRKAGDDKARNRFAGSFIKQASASTLVAIETKPGDLLELNIDARTFYGCQKVHARFNQGTYAFNRVPDEEVKHAKAEEEQAGAERWLVALWKSRQWENPVSAADAAGQWKVKRQTATPRLGKLVARGWLIEEKRGSGKATEWKLAPAGLAALKAATEGL